VRRSRDADRESPFQSRGKIGHARFFFPARNRSDPYQKTSGVINGANTPSK